MLGSEATVRHPTQGGIHSLAHRRHFRARCPSNLPPPKRLYTFFQEWALSTSPLEANAQRERERERVPPSIPGRYRVPHKPEIESPREWRVKNCIGWGRAGSSQKPSSRSVEAGQMSHPPRGVCVEVVAIPDSSAQAQPSGRGS
jgi:hypothetical protein